MNFLDQVSLFLHVLAAAGIIGGGIVQVMTGRRLQTAGDAAEIRRWAGFARSAGPLLAGSALVSLATGGHLAGSVWTTESMSGFAHPFITLGAAALVVLVPVGPMVGGARLRRLAADAEDGADFARLAARARSGSLWGPIYSLIGVCVGLVWVMSAKPATWLVTGLILLGTFGAGWLVGHLVTSTDRIT